MKVSFNIFEFEIGKQYEGLLFR